MTKPEDKPRRPAVGTPLDGLVVRLAPMEQLLAFCDWERKHNPHPEGKPHIAEWAAAEIERLNTEVAELDALRDRLAELLTGVAVALRGPQPPLTRWSWHDLPERAAAAIAAIDVMQRAAFMAADPERHNGTMRQEPTR